MTYAATTAGNLNKRMDTDVGSISIRRKYGLHLPPLGRTKRLQNWRAGSASHMRREEGGSEKMLPSLALSLVVKPEQRKSVLQLVCRVSCS